MSRSAAFLSDVHGNLPALEAVLADIDARGIDEIYFLGDVLGKGQSVHEVLDLLRRRCRGAVYGNWDRLVLYSPGGRALRRAVLPRAPDRGGAHLAAQTSSASLIAASLYHILIIMTF